MIRTLKEDIKGYDICIVGGGPAGLVIAAELAYSGLKICVLESGGERRASLPDSLKEVQYEKFPIRLDSRERLLGGAGTVWGGIAAPLDAVDFEERPWGAGWPITQKELEPYWRSASRYGFPALEEFKRNHPYWDVRSVQEKLFIALRPPFNFARLRSIFERDMVDLFLRATVIRLVSRAENDLAVITGVVCRTAENKEVRVSAQTFVLATGGIENPRILLVSNIGNQHDQVGRYFMNHPKGYSGHVHLWEPLGSTSPYLPRSIGSHMQYAGFTLPESVRRTKGLLSSYVQFEPTSLVLQRYAYGLWRRLPSSFASLFNLLRPRTLRLRWYADMEPRSGNRVSLSQKKDIHGVPLPVVSFETGSRDKKTLQELHAYLRSEVERLNLGRVEGEVEEILSAAREDASHHMGTTRMGTDPRNSVTNSNGLVHGSSNLYVAGSSLFPSGGSANPTYTIVALSIRLAGHLHRAIQKKEQSVQEVQQEPSGDGVIIIGAGKRVSEDVLPAIESLQGVFRILGLYARRQGEVFGSKKRYSVRPLDSLSEEVLRVARFVYIAVPSSALSSVLLTIPPRPHLELIIDTPAPVSAGLRKKLAAYERVHIAEDSVFLPWLSLVKKPVRQIACMHSVYRYHGIALLRALGGPVRWGWRWNNTFYLRIGKIRVRVVEPRNYERGTLHIDNKQPELLLKDNRCKAIILDDVRVDLSPEESELAGFMEEGDSVVSRMLELKRVGLRRLLLAAQQKDRTWTLEDGIHDVRVDRIIHRYGAYLRLR